MSGWFRGSILSGVWCGWLCSFDLVLFLTGYKWVLVSACQSLDVNTDAKCG